MTSQKKLTVVITADSTQFSRNLKSVSKELQGFGKKITQLTSFFAGKTAASVRVAMKVQDAFKTIQAGTGATGMKLKELQNEFKKLARIVPEFYQETATAIADLNAMPGLSDRPLREMGKAVLDVTRLAGGDLKGNIAAVAKAMNAWQVDAAAGTGV